VRMKGHLCGPSPRVFDAHLIDGVTIVTYTQG
jgi:hypothetical protein